MVSLHWAGMWGTHAVRSEEWPDQCPGITVGYDNLVGIVSWRVSLSLRTDFVLDALEQAVDNRAGDLEGLVQHRDRGTQYLQIRYTERLAEAGLAPSGGSRGDSYEFWDRTLSGSRSSGQMQLARDLPVEGGKGICCLCALS